MRYQKIVRSVVMLLICMLAFSFVSFAMAAGKNVNTLNVFKDIKKGDWYVKNGSIDFVYNKGFFKGATNTTFEPNTPVTRGMFVTVLGRLHGVKEVSAKTQFTDVKKSAYYSGFVAWAAKGGIVTGTGKTTFAPENPVTREQICAMMFRYCDFANIALKKINKAMTFKDAKEISPYAKKAVAACQTGAIVSGKGGGIFDPQAGATRAEVATILMNFYNNYKVDAPQGGEPTPDLPDDEPELGGDLEIGVGPGDLPDIEENW